MGQAKHKKPPTISVCIATIPPRAELLRRAVDSVHAQTLLPNELIVQLDTEGEGAGPTRNKAWRQASSDWVAFLDDDDEFLPDHLEECARVAKRTNADLVYPWFELINWPEATPDRPDPLATMQNGKLVHPLGVPFGPEQRRHVYTTAWIPATIFVKRVWLERVDGYPAPYTPEWEARDGCEDWALLVRLLDRGARFAHAPKRTWRLHNGSGTAGRPWHELVEK